MSSNDSQIIGRECPWRYTAEIPKVGGLLDARAMLPFVVMTLHLRLWTFYVAVVGTVIFAIMGLFRITPIEGVKGLWGWIVTIGYRANHIGHRRKKQIGGREQ